MTRDEYYNALEHSAFKYIDKWKSKAGNWVYRYADDVSNKAKSSSNVANNFTKQDTNFEGKRQAYINKTLFMDDQRNANRYGQLKQAYAQRGNANKADEYNSKLENEKRIANNEKAVYEYKLSEYKNSFPGKIDIAMKFVKNFFGR